MGESLADIERLLSDDAKALARLRELTVAAKGTNQHTEIKEDADNISILPDMFTAKPKKRKASAGTSRAYTLSRLSKDRPDLFEKVCNKELTANAAAKLAGWRKQASRVDP